MSCYLTIKKNGTRIGTWSRSTKAFSLFHGADYTEKEFDPVSVFRNAIAEIRAEIPDYEKSIRVAKLSLEGCMDADERYYLASSIVEYEDTSRTSSGLHLYESYRRIIISLSDNFIFCKG